MALTDEQRTQLRQEVSKGVHPDYDKATINAALDATDGWITENEVAAAPVIDAATDPYVFSDDMKKKIINCTVKLRVEEA